MTRSCWLLAVLLLVACSSSTAPGSDSKALRAGTYNISFNVPNSFSTPGGLIGDHELTFRVVDPVSEPSSFTLLSSVKTSRTVSGGIGSTTNDYLDPDPRSIVSADTQWRLQWWYAGSQTLAIRVNTSEGDNGTISLPFGCDGVRNEFETYQGAACVVARLE